ncbi:MAG: DUF2121 domain-containing protein [Methanomicrobiales archaeon]|nr:DUF2121 domain-containing protein [Methanomicrobiales archaeon]
MSLVIAFIGSSGAAIAGDMREITFQGTSKELVQFEEELYSGVIKTDDALAERAQELGIHLRIRDSKEKIREQNGILVGEVSDFEGGVIRKRRMYVTTGRYALAEIEGPKLTVTSTGIESRFVILGNPVTQRIARDTIRDQWKEGTLSDAVRLIISIMETAARTTASVSKNYLLLQTTSMADIEAGIEEDTKLLSR